MPCFRLFVLLALLFATTRADAQAAGGPAPEHVDWLRKVPTSELVRADLLARGLAELARDDGNRPLRGWLSVGAGVTLAGVAGFMDEPQVWGMLALGSAVSLGHGVTQLSISTGARETVAAMEQEPMADLNSWRARLAIGERGLRRAARRSRRTRIVQGSLTVFGAVAFVPLTWATTRIDDPQHRFGDQAFDYVGMTLSIIAAASGLVQALVPTPAERLHERYSELR